MGTVTLKKVKDYFELFANDKPKVYESLVCDLQFVEGTKADLYKKFQAVEDDLNNKTSQLKDPKDVHKALQTQEYVNALISKENIDLKMRLLI